MKIGILITSISNFGQRGFYNSQEIGLAKALSKKNDAVEVYKLVPIANKKRVETIDSNDNATVHFIPAKNFGINGFIDIRELDKSLDALIHFADTQFSVPVVYKWCEKNTVQYIPYIGVVESHSTSKLKQFVTNFMFRRNIAVYKKCVCCVKTPTVQSKLGKINIERAVVTPVGLDMDLLKQDFLNYDPIKLKSKYGYQEREKILLFVGRLIEEKQPVRMIEIFAEILKVDANYKLLMVGSGELRETVNAKIKELGIQNKVQILEQIPNSDIWELYRFSEAFINLNQQEIFGMAILEAMYYGCKVVAWKAPGPNYIITENKTGYLVSNNAQMIEDIVNGKDVSKASHQKIVNEFTWDNMAEKINIIVSERRS